MNSTVIVAIVLVVIAVAVVIGLFVRSRNRRRQQAETMGLPDLGALSTEGLDKEHASKPPEETNPPSRDT